ncbi:hypothetical protein NL108_011997 [Boleophthalmus pectinirostris]|uniref:SH2 domain-containing protein 4A n=1 Tax=Boleophthalmus pectinirostris TaxID=150288 RepID=UPI000A1C6FD1|nr:SH2 domain-containing protein 4A [Boleophthalmus pectinirostris]XP_020773521.1 SH2 domain-containing protein 4A [Boleophthalmus pectinirostris]KAJ0050098.1 hypothetical protein NL108_011997 [Boleophthalmus pectinirostris]
MLAKILEDMWVDPDVLEALSEEQKRILFVKMREEQVRRWRVREEEERRNGLDYCDRANKTAKSKQVSWLLGRDGDVSVIVIGETDEFRGCKLLQNINNRLQGDNLNGIQTQSPGNEELDFKQEENTHATDDLSSSPLASSEEDMDVKESDSSDSDSGSASDALTDWAPPLYKSHPRLHPHGTTHREQGAGGKELLSNEKPPSSRGRVAELRKAFVSESSAPSSGSKPPLPAKPLHLQRMVH